MEDSLFAACQFREKCPCWRDAIRLACSPLEEQQIVSKDYAQAIISATEESGPWYILSPAFALPHARPEEGVLSQQTHLSLLSLKEPVAFPDHPGIRLVIVLAAANSTQHIETIQRLVCWLDDGDRLQRLSAICSAEELHSALYDQACATGVGC
ncbi:PTS sugar transporter subunit IIA [Superficieibacter sp.]|uniref:PTS sugar transporter subunit IIA n=1 Tax=Superficieibacter sp. TaxID=2303322 RepID=UPI0028AEC2DC|nr:PTS sugar transporter subunit IIA [Superficieibacter sp.]